MSNIQRLVTRCVMIAVLLFPVRGRNIVQAQFPVAAVAPVVSLNYFRLNKPEAAKGEPVMAQWSFTGRARQVKLVAASQEGILLPYSWTARPTNTGALTFTVPYSLYTLSPMMLTLNVDGKYLSSTQLLITCDHAWFFMPRPERCPSVPIKPTAAAMQVFEGGLMFWLQDRDAIFVMVNPGTASVDAGRWETFIDFFEEGSPETDPLIIAPAGKLQPKRGFGLLWRTQPRVREALGWALAEERGYTACVGGGFGGWKSYRSYMNDADNRILELDSYYMPTTWQLYEATAFRGCE